MGLMKNKTVMELLQMLFILVIFSPILIGTWAYISGDIVHQETVIEKHHYICVEK